MSSILFIHHTQSPKGKAVRRDKGVEKEGVGRNKREGERGGEEVRPSFFSVDWHICHLDCASIFQPRTAIHTYIHIHTHTYTFIHTLYSVILNCSSNNKQ